MEGFNSKLVRLKVGAPIPCLVSFSMFQFQTGSIKRREVSGALQLDGSFNSKLVRLKANSAILAKTTFYRFNSKLVRLKGWHATQP